MLNTNITHYTNADIVSQVASYFDVVDNCVQAGDTDKRYKHVQTSVYGSNIITNTDYASFIISPGVANTADLQNSFITGKLKFKVNLDKACAEKKASWKHSFLWVGFKDAMHAVEKYEILANGESKYTQNDAFTESYLTGLSITNAVKKTDYFSKSRHKDAWNEKNSCGVILDFNDGSKEKDVEIPFRIDIRRFLPLSDIKYLPAFAGKIELKVLFSTAGLVYSPVNPFRLMKSEIKDFSRCESYKEITCSFEQIGRPVYMITDYTDVTKTFMLKDSKEEAINYHTVIQEARTLSTNGIFTIIKPQITIPQFNIERNVYDRLVSRYSDGTRALTIPMKTMHTGSFGGLITNGQPVSYTYTPRFVDTIFLTFPLSGAHKNVFINPCFNKLEISAEGYGKIPNSSISTIKDPIFIELCQQALNVNEDVEGLSDEVIKSLVHNISEASNGLDSNDVSNFFVGLVVEPPGTFQQGQTSNTPIDYTLETIIDEIKGDAYIKKCNVAPKITFLQDREFCIQLDPAGGPPLVSISADDITTPY